LDSPKTSTPGLLRAHGLAPQVRAEIAEDDAGLLRPGDSDRSAETAEYRSWPYRSAM
jgi:hypothetical protein